MPKTIEENFRDWEGDLIGYGYGTGEPHTVPIVRRFLELCPDEGGYAWLTKEGKALKAFAMSKSADELVDIVCDRDEDYIDCMRDTCNCGPNGYEAGKRCPNPFWPNR